MKETDYHKLVQTAVTVFLHNDNKYLFLKRNLNKRIDPGKLNGVGGRVEPGEDYIKCCIREVEEETGYKISSENINFSGFVRLEGGYEEDWNLGIFTVNVENFEIPNGSTTKDGEFIWVDKDKILDSDFDLVADLKYYCKDLVEEKRIFFMTATFNSKLQIENTSISFLDKS